MSLDVDDFKVLERIAIALEEANVIAQDRLALLREINQTTKEDVNGAMEQRERFIKAFGNEQP